MKKLYEFSALLNCHLVVAADDEESARAAVESLEGAWYETGDFIEVSDVDLVDIRTVDPSDIEDLSHEIA